MACAIDILTVTATKLSSQTKANTVTVAGIAQDCAQVQVTLNCTQSSTKVANVGANGAWAVTFDTSSLGCTCDQSVGISAACLDNPECVDETSKQITCDACPSIEDRVNIIVHLDPLPECLEDPMTAMVTLSATGSSFGNGKYNWDFGDNTSAVSNVPSVTHQYELPGTYIIKLTFDPSQPGCLDTTAYGTLHVPRCSEVDWPRPKGIIEVTDVIPKPTDPVPHPDPLVPPDTGKTPVTDVTSSGSGGARFNCDALLVGAIALMLASGLATVVGVCTNVPWVTVAGIVGTVLGIGLFLLWIAICGRISSCDVMRSMYNMLRMIILVGGPILLVTGLLQWAKIAVNLHALCWGAILGYYGGIAFLKDRLEAIMTDRGCPPTSIF